MLDIHTIGAGGGSIGWLDKGGFLHVGPRSAGAEPGPLFDKLTALWSARATLDPPTVALSLATIAVIAGLKKVRPSWPGMLIAVAGAAFR